VLLTSPFPFFPSRDRGDRASTVVAIVNPLFPFLRSRLGLLFSLFSLFSRRSDLLLIRCWWLCISSPPSGRSFFPPACYLFPSLEIVQEVGSPDSLTFYPPSCPTFSFPFCQRTHDCPSRPSLATFFSFPILFSSILPVPLLPFPSCRKEAAPSRVHALPDSLFSFLLVLEVILILFPFFPPLERGQAFPLVGSSASLLSPPRLLSRFSKRIGLIWGPP